MKQLITLILLVTVSSYMFAGCANIFEGTKEDVDLSSEPPGANVYVNGQNRGKTPLTLNLKKGKEYNIEFRKDGFETKLFVLQYSLGAGWLILDILAGLIGIIVDASTGAWNGFETNAYKAILDEKQ